MKGIGRTIKRRRKENKTDYKARLGLLKSGKNRLVIRKTNRFIIAQIVGSNIAQDEVIIGVNSKELISKGWPKEKIGSLKNLQACYLTGFLLGKKYNGEEVILDIGLKRNVHKGRIYAVLKGAVEAGLNIKHNEESLLSDERINDEKMKEIVKKIKEKRK